VGKVYHLTGQFTPVDESAVISYSVMTAPATWTAIGTQIALGFGLSYAVVKFFDTVGDRLNEDTRLEIAVWLLGRKKLSATFESWPDTFTKVFDRVFGAPRFRVGFVSRIFLISFIVAAAVLPFRAYQDYMVQFHGRRLPIEGMAIFAWLYSKDYFLRPDWLFPFAGSVISCAIAVGETRVILSALRRSRRVVAWLLYLLADLAFTIVTAYLFFGLLDKLTRVVNYPTSGFEVWWPMSLNRYILEEKFNYLPSLLTSIWLWLYAGSGFLLKAARRFDIGFDWFNRHMDIEKKPLQSIGLVAGAIVAVVYWGTVVVMRVV
jgi:hypothetical protein